MDRKLFQIVILLIIHKIINLLFLKLNLFKNLFEEDRKDVNEYKSPISKKYILNCKLTIQYKLSCKY